MFKKLLVFLLVLAFVPAIYAGTTGKIAGQIKDKATGEPLPGVNVIISGTVLGSATDIDGYYSILNVPAGTHSVDIQYIGYRNMAIEQVRITPDITKRLSLELEAESLEFEDVIVIVAERPFFELSATNTVRVMDSEELERIPVTGITQKVALNAGVVMADGSGGETDNAEINVRGGRGNESLIVIDGIPQNDMMMGNAAGTIPDNSIEQVSSQIGGFSAKYGNAQSSVINIVTKAGQVNYSGSLEGIYSNLTDAYNYRSFNGSISGPIIPGENKFTFFGSAEYMQTDDAYPSAIGLDIPSTGVKTDVLPDNEGEVLRFSGKVTANLSNFKITGSTSGSFRDDRQYTHSYAKNNSAHNPKEDENILNGALRFSHTLNNSTFWNLNVRYRQTDFEEGDGVHFDDLNAYGDTLYNPLLENQGTRRQRDDDGAFFKEGRVSNFYRKYEMQTYGLDFNFTKQYKSHLIEFGGLAEQSSVSYFEANPAGIATNIRGADAQSALQRFNSDAADITHYGYDITGNAISSTRTTTIDGTTIEESAPKKPVTAAFYLQDKIEFDDFILNLGGRVDYFDPATQRVKNQLDVHGYGNPGKIDAPDFEDAPTELYLSPRLGFAFPVTEFTVFHAQYGIFRQQPRYFDIYDSWSHINRLETDRKFTLRNGHVQSESTTQYEFGFKRQFGNDASLDITAYYKNVKGLTNTITKWSQAGESRPKDYFTPNNTDFGTVRGFAVSFNLRRVGPLSMKLDYTYANADGTGSSQNSSYVATFRNTNNEVPKSVAALDFDQRHTLTASVDLRTYEGEGPELGGVKFLENTGANFIVSYNSGRPYTPASEVNILQGNTNYGNLTQYINTAYFPGAFRVDMKVDKRFDFGDISSVVYLTVLNLFDRENIVDVWRSTGDADNTAFLDTPAGVQTAEGSQNGPEAFREDYKALEKDPTNYGMPRQVRLGLKILF